MKNRSITAILVNLDANKGKAKFKWQRIADQVLDAIPGGIKIIEYRLPFDLKACLAKLLTEHHVSYIISAGGDGTANMLLNHFISFPKNLRSGVVIGFIGLGSSNDILKPINNKIQDIPVRLDYSNIRESDIGCVSYKNKKDEHLTRYFLANSSIGVGAYANYLFNTEDTIIKFTKPRLTNFAIIYTALKSILKYKNIDICLDRGGIKENIELSYLVALKTPFISGNLKFDQEIEIDEGYLGINICKNMNRWELIKLMLDLQNGRFQGKNKRETFKEKELHIVLNAVSYIEFDGEVDVAREAFYKVSPEKIKVLA